MITLYDYWRSSAAYRVRIALNLKGLAYRQQQVHLLKDGGEQHGDAYRRVNPQALVPALDADGALLTQSLAIVEYLDDLYPSPPLLPSDPAAKARVRAMALALAADTHPLQNLRVLNYLRQELQIGDEGVARWSRHWIAAGLGALEAMVARAVSEGRYCHGDTVTMADVVLVPQLYNARRFGCDLTPYARLRAIDDALQHLDAFARAAPERQQRA
ncbi:MAG: maleylacetoacetate isomerase [Alphaproteobacteria bacterium]|nr:MAG: maleylacetoacetate isomerase [Alphaproteobacteria bacterium]